MSCWLVVGVEPLKFSRPSPIALIFCLSFTSSENKVQLNYKSHSMRRGENSGGGQIQSAKRRAGGTCRKAAEITARMDRRPAADYTARVIPHCSGVTVPLEADPILRQR